MSLVYATQSQSDVQYESRQRQQLSHICAPIFAVLLTCHPIMTVFTSNIESFSAFREIRKFRNIPHYFADMGIPGTWFRKITRKMRGLKAPVCLHQYSTLNYQYSTLNFSTHACACKKLWQKYKYLHYKGEMAENQGENKFCIVHIFPRSKLIRDVNLTAKNIRHSLE